MSWTECWEGSVELPLEDSGLSLGGGRSHEALRAGEIIMVVMSMRCLIVSKARGLEPLKMDMVRVRRGRGFSSSSGPRRRWRGDVSQFLMLKMLFVSLLAKEGTLIRLSVG